MTTLGLGACMGKDGDKHLQPAKFSASDASYQLEFSDPPWHVVKKTERGLRLQVDSEIFGVSLGKAVPPMHILIASPVRLDEHLKDLIDPGQLSDILEQAGVPKDKIPTNFDTIDTKALESLSNANLTSLLDAGSSFLGGTSTASGIPTFPGVEGRTQGESSVSVDTGTGAPTKEPSTDKKNPAGDVKVPSVPEYLVGVDLKNTRDVAVAELNFLVRENDARIVDGLQYFTTHQGLPGVTYQLAMSPGVYVRNLYVPTKDYTLRVGVMSLFELSNEDIHRLFMSVHTDVPADEKGR